MAQLHPRDIDVVAREDRSDRSDHAGLVAMVGDQHVAGQRAVERETVDLHDGGVMAVPDDGDVVRQQPVFAPDDLEREIGQSRRSASPLTAHQDASFVSEQVAR